MTLNKEIVLVCAFRYALGRRTYVVSSVVEELAKHWLDLSTNSQALFRKEILQHEKEFGNLGDACDESCWKQLVSLADISLGGIK